MKSLPAIKRTRKRWHHHLWLAGINFGLTAFVYGVLSLVYPSPQSWIFRWSLATGYIGAGLLATTLSLGAWKIWRGQSNPVSTHLRRDIGIWCGVLSIAHVVVGLNVHMKSWSCILSRKRAACERIYSVLPTIRAWRRRFWSSFCSPLPMIFR